MPIYSAYIKLAKGMNNQIRFHNDFPIDLVLIPAITMEAIATAEPIASKVVF
jgi:hypothetical protein